jgi:hypothetical protein
MQQVSTWQSDPARCETLLLTSSCMLCHGLPFTSSTSDSAYVSVFSSKNAGVHAHRTSQLACCNYGSCRLCRCARVLSCRFIKYLHFSSVACESQTQLHIHNYTASCMCDCSLHNCDYATSVESACCVPYMCLRSVCCLMTSQRQRCIPQFAQYYGVEHSKLLLITLEALEGSCLCLLV